jgi:hypothetical protein
MLPRAEALATSGSTAARLGAEMRVGEAGECFNFNKAIGPA